LPPEGARQTNPLLGVPQGLALWARIFTTKDLELLGVEFWVSNHEGDRFIPHRKIYDTSNIRVIPYFKNSGIGDIDVSNLTCRIVEGPVTGGGSLRSGNNTVLKAGEQRKVFFNLSRRIKAGTYLVRIKLDPDDKLPERSEENNEKSFEFTVTSTPAAGIPFASGGIIGITPKFDMHPLLFRIYGDADINGNGPTVVVEGEYSRTARRIFLRGNISISFSSINRSILFFSESSFTI